MSPKPRKGRWLRRLFALLFVTGLGLLLGTATGRMQAYRALFSLGSDELQLWAARRMSEESAEAALPVIFAMLEDPEIALPLDLPPDLVVPFAMYSGPIDGLYRQELLRCFLKTAPSRASDRRLIRAALQAGLDHSKAPPDRHTFGNIPTPPLPEDFELPSPTLPADETLAALRAATRNQRPALRVFASTLITQGLKDRTFDRRGRPLSHRPAARERLREALRRLAADDPEPRVRCHAFACLAEGEADLDFFLDRFEQEGSPLVRGQILRSLNQGKILRGFDASSMSAEEESRRVVSALFRFWGQKLRQALETSKARRPLLALNLDPFRRYGDEGQLQALAWIREHPEDAVLLREDRLGDWPEGERRAEVNAAALALLRESPHPQVVSGLAALLIARGVINNEEQLSMLRARLSETSAEEAARRHRFPRSDRFSPERRREIGAALLEALSDPRQRRLLTADFAHPYLRAQAGSEALLTSLASDPDPEVSFAARCALFAFPGNARSAPLQELFASEGRPLGPMVVLELDPLEELRFTPLTRSRLRAMAIIKDLGLPVMFEALRRSDPALLKRRYSLLFEPFGWELITEALNQAEPIGQAARDWLDATMK